MTQISIFSRAALLASLAAATLLAGDTHIWSQSDYSDFEKGIVKNLSVRSDGMLTLAPQARELLDTSSAYLWALARDSKGNLYAGGGANAKIYRIPPDGKGKVLAELDGLEVQAIAVDAKDRVYAATAPDGKIYRISGSGKPEVFFDPKATYIWALVFDRQGNLFVATGGNPGSGEIYRVSPDGKGAVFFKTDETHVRSMAIDAKGNLIAGTDPGGLVLRISPQGQGFVLYQMPKAEVTALAVGSDGSIYAAAVGAKHASSVLAPAPQSAQASPLASMSEPGAPATIAVRPMFTPPLSLGHTSGISGGSDVYRIGAGGDPEQIWSDSHEVVYAIAFDREGRVLLGAGNRGNIYRIESPTLYTALLNLPATQVTAFQTGANGHLYAITGNVGKVYDIAPGVESEGTVESDVFDASLYSLWGRVSFEGHLNGGKIAIQTRSGNLDQPHNYWSSWSDPVTASKGGPAGSPAARFVQWKATLTAGGADRSPELQSVDVAYLEKNVAPRLEQIEITPANYKFPAPIVPLLSLSQPQQTLSLPPLGHSASSTINFLDSNSVSTPVMQYAKGYIGARWLAVDPNGDPMTYSLEIRGVHETQWKPLKEKIAGKYYSWDSTAFPDGEYRLRLTASDSPGNPPSEALTARIESDPFLIDNTPPAISGLAAARNGSRLEVRWHAADALSNIDTAEYSLDGGDWTMAAPVTRLSDSPELDYNLTLDAGPGEHTVAVRVADDSDNRATAKVLVQP